MEKNLLDFSDTEPEIPAHETPSCRLAEHSADYLSDTELLSLILKGSMGTAQSLETARKLLSAYGSIKRLFSLSLAELQRFPGIGFARACAIQSALALARRLNRPDSSNSLNITTPGQVAEYMRGIIGERPQEEFHVLLLDVKHHLIRSRMITKGLVDRSQVHAREVFRPAIAENCARVVLAHNHPSGDPTPSSQDVACTKNLVESGKIIGIEVLDHVVIGRPSVHRTRYWLSFREENLIKS